MIFDPVIPHLNIYLKEMISMNKKINRHKDFLCSIIVKNQKQLKGTLVQMDKYIMVHQWQVIIV